MSIHRSAIGARGYGNSTETNGGVIQGDKWRAYRLVTLCPSGTGAAEGRSCVDATAAGTAFVRLVVSIVLGKGRATWEDEAAGAMQRGGNPVRKSGRASEAAAAAGKANREALRGSTQEEEMTKCGRRALAETGHREREGGPSGGRP